MSNLHSLRWVTSLGRVLGERFGSDAKTMNSTMALPIAPSPCNEIVSRSTSLLLAIVVITTQADAALITVGGLTTVRFWESTGPFVPYDFGRNSPEMTTQLGVGALGPTSFDFSPLVDENYDVFYSDANGNFNVNGDYVTVEAVFPHPAPFGGGLNLGAVDLVINNQIYRSDILASWVGLGNNYIPGSELLAVDADTPIPSTDTTMGNTSSPIPQHLRVTVGWSSVPEPASGGFLGLGLTAMLLRRARRNSKSTCQFGSG